MLGTSVAKLAATALLVGAGLFGTTAPVVAAELGATAPQPRVEAAEAPSGTVTETASVNDITWGP
ncbi:hypothetical protein ACFXGT_06315 [Streptomyces sp. NPDC059352]|uniref:hypothetical protein n=1 Tax=Streptomyces sp. NPDC059352 TaxID=3346810 RepID=UPI0036C8CCCD